MSWSSDNDPHSSDYLLREIRDEIRSLRQTVSFAANPPPPPPLPPPATKDFVAGVPDEFLVETYDGKQYKYTKNTAHGGWDRKRRYGVGGYDFDDNVGRESAREALEAAHRVWIPYKK